MRGVLNRCAAIAVACGLLVGCGSGGQAEKLSEIETARIARINEAFAFTVLDGSDYGRTLDGVDQLIALCREKPEAKYEELTVRQVVADGINTLREYRPELAADLETGCPPAG